MKLKKIRTVILGLGSIGFSYDVNNKKDIVLTHANAIKKQSKINLLAGIDSNKDKRIQFKEKYNIEVFSNLDKCFEKYHPDLVVISTPTKSHTNFLNQLIKYKFIKIIICEKPFTGNYNEARVIYKKYENSQINLYINFLRRYNNAIIKLRNNIVDNNLGKFYKGVVFYNKGLLENGSHFIDLMVSFFGNFKKINIIKYGRKWKNKDFEVEFIIEFKDISINFVPLNIDFYTYGNFQLFSNSHMVEYTDDEDIKIYKTKKNLIYQGEKKLYFFENYSYKKNQSILYLYDYIIKVYQSNKKINLIPDTTLETLKIIKNIIKIK